MTEQVAEIPQRWWSPFLSAVLFAMFGVTAGTINGCLNNKVQRERDDKLFGKVEEQRQEIAEQHREILKLREEVTRLRSR